MQQLIRSNIVEIQNARINTAGAYIYVQGFYLFAIGIHPHNGNIPIVRLGGHREKNETGWQCATREVYEEARVHIQPLPSHRTHLSEWDHLDTEFQEIQWITKIEQEPDPFLVVSYRREGNISLSLMYLVHTEEVPTPSSEVKGLLLLTKEDIYRLCREPQTLEQYLGGGGTAILNAKFDKSLILEPFIQLRLLSRLLSIHPEFKADFHE